jgi:hypothetical protein
MDGLLVKTVEPNTASSKIVRKNNPTIRGKFE